VTDVARANKIASKNSTAEGVIMNICTGRQISIMDLVMELQRIISGPQTIQKQSARIGDIYHSYGNPQKAKELISFTPEVDFIEGLKRTIEWMKQ
jgi:UDP-glucose 4-epimerase